MTVAGMYSCTDLMTVFFFFFFFQEKGYGIIGDLFLAGMHSCTPCLHTSDRATYLLSKRSSCPAKLHRSRPVRLSSLLLLTTPRSAISCCASRHPACAGARVPCLLA